MEHLPVLQVVIPLVLAPFCFVMPRYTWIVALTGSALSLICSVLLLILLLELGTLDYFVGGWPPPWGIGLRIDLLGGFILLLVSLIAVLVVTWAHDSIESEIRDDQINLFWCMFLLCLTGSFGIVVTGDAFNVFVFLELSLIHISEPTRPY